LLESVPKDKCMETIAAANHNRESLIKWGKDEDFGLEHVKIAQWGSKFGA
jgi:hypothetical protein